tara:strand:+ start:992 stop:1807 length:816 start_codon:yes stop_codon:yes gene_type:complete
MKKSNSFKGNFEKFDMMVLGVKSDAYRVQFVNGFNKNVIGVLGERAVDSLTTRDVVKLIDGISSNSVANRVLSGLVSFLGWCCGRGECLSNVAAGIPRRVEVSRDVLIDVVELSDVVNSGVIMSEVRDILKVMMLTGLRHGTIRKLSSVNVCGDNLVICKSIVKNRRDLVVPMLPEVKLIMMKYESGFTVSGVKMSKELSKTGVDWTCHDIRHLIGTNLGQMRVESTLISRILGHAVKGSTEIYNHHNYVDEKREVLCDLRDRFIDSGMMF